MSIGKLLTNRNFYSVVLAVVISFAFVAVMVNGATTISSNISTGGTLTVTGASTLSSTLAVTGVATFSDQLTLDNAASDPTGTAAGSIYWDTAREVIRVYDGLEWNTVASSTDAAGGLILGGDDNGVRFNTVASGYMALGTSTLPFPAANANGLLFLNATTSVTVPLVIAGYADQTGDLTQILDANLAEVFAIDAFGNASTSALSTTAGDSLWVGGFASTTGENGNFATQGTLSVVGASTFGGGYTAGDGSGVTIGTDGALQINANFDVNGYATTTAASGNFNTEGTIGLSTSTPAFSAKLGVTGDVTLGSSGTTTISLHTSGSGGTCLQMVASDGQLLRIYFDNANAQVIETGPCSDGGS